MPKQPKKPSQASNGNPYIKKSVTTGPIAGGTSRWVNKIHTIKSKADVFVSWASKGPSTASFTKPFKTHFNQNASTSDVSQTWGVAAVMPRRDFNDLEADTSLPGAPDAIWQWDAFVTVAGDGDTVESVGKNIAASLTDFAMTSVAFNGQKHKPKFVYNPRPVESQEAMPLSHFLLDRDVVEVFKSVYGENEMDVLLQQEDILENFFGSADKGRTVLIGTW
jgi:hypothetical protein